MNPLQTLLYQFLVLSLFLLSGYVLRLRVGLFQRILLPASVIGGGLGLLLGPATLGEWALLPIPETWMSEYARFPGVLITPILAAAVLGTALPSQEYIFRSLGGQIGYAISFYWSQFAVGGAVGLLLAPYVYPTFGLELFAGFAGGHATSGIYGQSLQRGGMEWWMAGQGVALVTATAGLVTAVAGGIFLINWTARRGETAFLHSPVTLPAHLLQGVIREPDLQPSAGRSVTASDVIDPFTFTACLIALPTLAGLLAAHAFQVYDVPALKEVGAFAWALLASWALWMVLNWLGLAWLVDPGIKNRVSGVLVDYLVVAAMISLPLRAVAEHILAIVVLIGAGILGALLMFFAGKWLLSDHWVERSIITYGQGTGVTATGLLLLRVTDAEFKSPALTAWGVAYGVTFPPALIYLGLSPLLLAICGHGVYTLVSLLIALAGMVAARLIFRFNRGIG